MSDHKPRRTRAQIIRRNILLAPFVLLVRAPLMLPLLAIHIVGEWARKALEWLHDRMPAWEPVPRKVSAEQREHIMENWQ